MHLRDSDTAQRASVHVALLVVALLLLGSDQTSSWGSPGLPGGAWPSRDIAATIFQTNVVERVDLRLDEGARAELAREPKDYVAASVRFRHRNYEKVSVRLKGNRSLRRWDGKPSFKIKFGVKGDFFGMKSLVLNNMVEDPTMLRETLAYSLFRDAGIPAPRTAYAEVFVNDEPFGLYLMLESDDERMLSRALGDGSGPLYEGEYGCDLYEEDVPRLKFQSGDPASRSRLNNLVSALDSKEGPLLDRIAKLMNVDRLLTFLALSQLIGDFDGYNHAHNYRLYENPATATWELLPWGVDRVLKKALPIYDSDGRLAKECFADSACRLAYVKRLQREARRFGAANLLAEITRLDRLIARFVKRDRRRPYSTKKRQERLQDLRTFVRERPRQIAEQTTCWNGSAEVDRDGDGYGCSDCDDSNRARHPGAEELCNERDDNCSGLVDDSPACVCQAVDAEGMNFDLCDLPMTFQAAQDFCGARGQALARIDGRKQARQLHKAAKKVKKVDWWIGLSDRAREGQHRWLDGSKVDRKLWGSGEPDDYQCGQNCAALLANGKGRFRDLHCYSRQPFICSEAQD